MDCQRSPRKTGTETRRRARSCTGSRSRSLRGKPETFPWAQGGPCDHAAVAGKPRLWPGGGGKARVRVSRARPQSALSGQTRGEGQRVPSQPRQSFGAIPPRRPGPHKMPLCRRQVQAPEDPVARGRGDRSPRGGKRCPALQNLLRVPSPPRVRRVPPKKRE